MKTTNNANKIFLLLFLVLLFIFSWWFTSQPFMVDTLTYLEQNSSYRGESSVIKELFGLLYMIFGFFSLFLMAFKYLGIFLILPRMVGLVDQKAEANVREVMDYKVYPLIIGGIVAVAVLAFTIITVSYSGGSGSSANERDIYSPDGTHNVQPHQVEGYYRSDGTRVEGYWRGGADGYERSNPDGDPYNNLR